MRKKIYELVYNVNNTPAEKIYDIIIIIASVISMVPLAFRETNPFFIIIEYATLTVFAIDFLLKLICADYRYKKSFLSFFIYPITPTGLIDIISIVPLLALFSSKFNWLYVAKFLRPLKLIRVFKFLVYSRSYMVLTSVFKKQKKILLMTFALAGAYILFSALIMFNIEPDIFKTYLDAVYWATISLTTVGYGDLTPVTAVGKLITIISSLVGVGIIAIPGGVITAGYIEEFKNHSEK